VVHDPGRWWSAIAATDARLQRWSANAAWWHVLCSEDVAELVRVSRACRLLRHVGGADLRRSAALARRALDAFCDPATYASGSSYMEATGWLAEHVRALNRSQNALVFSLDTGVRVAGLDYGDSRSLVAYARRQTVLSDLICAALAELRHHIDLLLVSVTSPEDLLCALITVHQLRQSQPRLHACLADHGYENFSLAPHLARLRVARTIDSVVDTVIESKDERDVLVPMLATALRAGQAPRGFLHLGDFDGAAGSFPHPYVPPPAVPTFAPEPIFWTRLSRHRCYWSRCAFCVQNAKYDEQRAPSLSEIEPAVDRLAALGAAGYHTFIFSDEALSPSVLDHFCRVIEGRHLAFRWSCRCKPERAFRPELCRRMGAAGCYEVLLGIESISQRVLRRMDKYVEGLDRTAIEGILRSLDDAGVGIHVNLIAGFPGDTVTEVADSVTFVVRSLAPLSNATFLLNRFALFPATPVFSDSSAFGVVPIAVSGDMPFAYPYRLAPEYEAHGSAIDRLLPALRERLYRGLGWNRLGEGLGARAARELYFLSGHGSVFKAQGPRNPFANPLTQAVEGPKDDSPKHLSYGRHGPRWPVRARRALTPG